MTAHSLAAPIPAGPSQEVEMSDSTNGLREIMACVATPVQRASPGGPTSPTAHLVDGQARDRLPSSSLN